MDGRIDPGPPAPRPPFDLFGRGETAPHPAPEPADTGGPPLAEADRQHLAVFERKVELVRDRVASVVTGRASGLYLYGRGGTGKSFAVITALRQHQADYTIHNSRMDGRGLFTALERNPASVHVLEDCEAMLRNRNVQGVLRSALWGQRDGDGPMERVVTWPREGGRRELRVHFTGGIIVTANLPLGDFGELEALATRIPVLNFTASDAEVRAVMRQLARAGYVDASGQRLSPSECIDVCEFLITCCQGLDRPLDLRLLVGGFEDFQQWSEGEAGAHWHGLITSRVRQHAAAVRAPAERAPVRPPTTRGDRLAIDRAIAREIAAETEDLESRLRLWAARTKKSRASFYRRLQETQCERDG